MAKKLNVTGCIVTYNNADIIEKCIQSLLENTKGVNFTLYISDNHSSDDTVNKVKEHFHQVKLIENKSNKGFGEGHNCVIPHLRSKYHFIINPDIFIDKDVISELTEYLEKHPDVAMVTPKILNPDSSEQYLPKRNPTLRYVLLSKFPRFKYLRKEYTRENEKISQPAEIDFCTGCFFGIRTKDFINTHGFDRRYFMYMEDADLSRKIRKKSKIIFLPGIYVYHEWKRDNIKSIRGMARWFNSMFKYFCKWGWKL